MVENMNSTAEEVTNVIEQIHDDPILFALLFNCFKSSNSMLKFAGALKVGKKSNEYLECLSQFQALQSSLSTPRYKTENDSLGVGI